MDVLAIEEGFDGLSDGEIEELLDEEQASDGVEFLGGSAEAGVNVFGELGSGHELQGVRFERDEVIQREVAEGPEEKAAVDPARKGRFDWDA